MNKNANDENLKSPKLRFPGFSGEWEDTRLGEIGAFLKGRGISKAHIVEHGKYKCIRYGELYTIYSEIISIVKSATNALTKESFLSKKNDLLIPSSGETAIDIAKVSCVKKENILLGGDLNVLRLEQNQDGDFFAYYLSHFQNRSISKLSQGHSVVHLYSSHLKNLKINIPTLPEQQKIADFLSSVDDWIKNLREQKAKLESYKKGMMQKIFSQQIRFKDDEGKEFPEWELGELGNLVELRKAKLDPSKYEGSKKCIELESLEKESGKLLKMFDSQKLKSIKNIFYKNDVLYGKLRPYLKKYFKPDFDGVCTTEIWVLNGTHLENNFLYYFIQTSRFNYFTSLSTGSRMPRAEWGVVRAFPILFPILREQQKIADILTSIDSLIESKQQQITRSERWKKGVLTGVMV